MESQLNRVHSGEDHSGGTLLESKVRQIVVVCCIWEKRKKERFEWHRQRTIIKHAISTEPHSRLLQHLLQNHLLLDCMFLLLCFHKLVFEETRTRAHEFISTQWTPQAIFHCCSLLSASKCTHTNKFCFQGCFLEDIENMLSLSRWVFLNKLQSKKDCASWNKNKMKQLMSLYSLGDALIHYQLIGISAHNSHLTHLLPPVMGNNAQAPIQNTKHVLQWLIS